MTTFNTDGRHQPDSCRANTSSESSFSEEPIPIEPGITPKIPKRLFNLVKELGSERTLHKNELLYAKDSRVHKLAVVIDGIIGRAVADHLGASTEAYAIATSFYLASGYLNFFSGRPCGQTCFAMTPARILECEADALKAELIKDPELFFEAAAHFEMCTASDNMALAARSWNSKLKDL